MVVTTIKFWIYLILANLFWAGNLIFGTFVVDEMSPFWITFIRWSLASLILIPTSFLLEKPEWSTVKEEWFPLLGMGILGIAGYNIVLMAALESTSATNAAFVNALNPGIIVLFSFIFLREKLSRMQITGLVLSIFGVLVILTKGNINDFLTIRYNKGDLFIIVTVVLWTFYSIIGKRLKTPPITATAVSTIFSCILLLPFALMGGIKLSLLGPLTIVGLIYMVIFPSVLSTVLWNFAVRGVGVNKSGVSMNLIPVFTALIALTLGEGITAVQIVGGLLVLSGVLITTGIVDVNLKLVKQNKSM